ncbi:MAG: Nif11-like leader peptide family RiPP precursor [Eubacteriales bacterium]
MEISKELIEKAKTAKSAEELLQIAKAENIELTAEEAEKAFAGLHKTGELSDEELDNVSGGCGDEIKWGSGNIEVLKEGIDFDFEIGTRVVVKYLGYFKCEGTIIDRKVDKLTTLYYTAYYQIRYDDPSDEDEWVQQDQVGVIV